MRIILLLLSFWFSFYSFAQNTKVTAPIDRNDPRDTTYGSHKDTVGIGGHMTFYKLSSRDSLPYANRRMGMTASVSFRNPLNLSIVDSTVTYQLQNGIRNEDWVRLYSGTSVGSQNLQQVLNNGNYANTTMILGDSAYYDFSGMYLQFWGDSWTAGSVANNPISSNRWSAKLTAMFPGAIEFNKGIGGTQGQKRNIVPTDSSFRSRKNQIISAGLPGYLFVMYGVNDVRNWSTGNTVLGFYNDMYFSIDSLINAGFPRARIILMSMGYFKGVNKSVIDSLSPLYVDTTRKIASKLGTGFIDMYTPFKTNANTWLYAPDSLHPNQVGHDSIARIVFNYVTRDALQVYGKTRFSTPARYSRNIHAWLTDPYSLIDRSFGDSLVQRRISDSSNNYIKNVLVPAQIGNYHINGTARIALSQIPNNPNTINPSFRVNANSRKVGSVLSMPQFNTINGVVGTYNNITPTPTAGVTGTGLIINISVANSVGQPMATVTFANNGTGYSPLDVVTIPRSSVGSPTAGDYRLIIGDVNSSNSFSSSHSAAYISSVGLGAFTNATTLLGRFQALASDSSAIGDGSALDVSLDYIDATTPKYVLKTNNNTYRAIIFNNASVTIPTFSATTGTVTTLNTTTITNTGGRIFNGGISNSSAYTDTATKANGNNSGEGNSFFSNFEAVSGVPNGVSVFTGGTGYTPGTYNLNTSIVSGNGTGLTITVTVNGSGIVSGVAIFSSASARNYTNNTIITATVPGGGSGFQASVAVTSQRPMGALRNDSRLYGNAGDTTYGLNNRPIIGNATHIGLWHHPGRLSGSVARNISVLIDSGVAIIKDSILVTKRITAANTDSLVGIKSDGTISVGSANRFGLLTSSDLTNYVTTNTTQTISANKDFTAGLLAQNNGAALSPPLYSQIIGLGGNVAGIIHSLGITNTEGRTKRFDFRAASLPDGFGSDQTMLVDWRIKGSQQDVAYLSDITDSLNQVRGSTFDSTFKMTATTTNATPTTAVSIPIQNGVIYDIQFRAIAASSGAEGGKYNSTVMVGNTGSGAAILDGGMEDIITPMLTSTFSSTSVTGGVVGNNFVITVTGVAATTVKWKFVFSIVKSPL